MNEHEWRNRRLKAQKLAAAVQLVMARNPGITLAQVEQADHLTCSLAAQLAGVRHPSPETWQVVCAILAGVPLDD